jgi:histidine triad (HIT) family protein
VFCQIAGGETAAHKVLEDDHMLAFLDSRPLFPGHCLLIPKTHYETLADLPETLVPKLFAAAQRLSRAVETALGAEGSFVGINNRVSQSVPHLHVHVVPRRKKDGLRGFFWPRNVYKDERQMQEVAEALRGALR